MGSGTEQKTILVVDDEDINLDLMQGILEDDYQVECFTSAQTCLAWCQDNQADLALLDVDMPEMDGLTLCRELLALQPVCPVMFISAMSSNDERMAGYEAGGYDYIVKPCDPTELLAKLALIFQQQQQYQDLIARRDDISKAFMEAATGSGELGRLVLFSANVFEVENYQQLAELVLSTLEELACLKGAVLVTGEQGEVACSNDGPCSPIEQEVLTMLRGKGRIYQFNQRVQVNEKHVSVLIKNMPEDEMTAGRMIDNIPLLLRIASACADKLDTAVHLKNSLEVSNYSAKKNKKTLGGSLFCFSSQLR